MYKYQINQFTPSITIGDGVSHSLFYTQRLLLELGIESVIFSDQIDERLHESVKHIDTYRDCESNILIYHHSIGHKNHDLIMSFKDKKILVYHNITPAHFFPNAKNLFDACTLGRMQAQSSKNFFVASYTDSDYNTKELLSFGYRQVETIPILKDFHGLDLSSFHAKISNQNENTYNILHVGRIVSNKAQHELINIVYGMLQLGVYDVKLFLVGGISELAYENYLRRLVDNLSLSQNIEFCGKVDDDTLIGYYKNCDLFLTLSNHEGFCIPLVEAMLFDVPVLAYAAGGINTTIPKCSILHQKSTDAIVEKILDIKNNPLTRYDMVLEQRNHLKQFFKHSVLSKFVDFLNRYLDLNISFEVNDKATTNSSFVIEGPFDSSYSLSIVNQNLALELSKQKNVCLYSTEGFGDFRPNEKYLSSHPKIKSLICSSGDDIDVTIRNLYPPRTNAMRGIHKIMGPYGWEESKFPQEYVRQFNSRLTVIACMSNYVKNLLQNNGVKIPIVVTGLGVENILMIEPQKLDFELPGGKKLLHISSCFPRKGADVLLKAFDKLCTDYDDLVLIIKTFPNPHNNIIDMIIYSGYLSTQVLSEGVMLYEKIDKKILLINKDLEQHHINYLYSNCDIFVAPTRGEGFGLPQAEAMLFGIPVVTTNYSGQTDFCSDDTAWLVDFEFDYAKTHMELHNSLWVEPCIDSLMANLQYLIETPREIYMHKIVKARNNILANFTWSDVVSKLENALAQYGQNIEKEIKIGIISTFDSKCGIAEYAKYLICKFNQDNLTIFSDTNSEAIGYNKANIVRCWESGDNTSENLDALIREIETKSISSLIVQYNFSFFSLSNLAKLISFCNSQSVDIYLFIHSVKDVYVENRIVKSFREIAPSLKLITAIFVHSLNDINYLKDMDIYKNTYLFDHGFNANLLNCENKIDTCNAEDYQLVVSTFGFLLPHKGVMELVKAVEILYDRGFVIKLILLNSIHPAPISQVEQNKLHTYILKSKIRNNIYFDSEYLEDTQIISILEQSDIVVFPYQNTQESSSAAARFGLMSLRPVLTTPLEIFDDIKNITYQTKGFDPVDIANAIIDISQAEHDSKKQHEVINNNSWDKISLKLYNMIYSKYWELKT